MQRVRSLVLLVFLSWVASCFDFETYSFEPKGTAGGNGLDECLASGSDQVTCAAEPNETDEDDAEPSVETQACRAEDGPRCQDLVPEVCSDGRWLAQAACDTGCEGGRCTECTSGTRCKDGAVESCANGFWGDPQKCDVTCEQGQCVAACSEGRTQCNGNTLQRCTGGEYVDDEPCPITCIAAASGDVCGGDCQPRANRCAEAADGSLLNAVQSCTRDAQWSDDTTDCASAFCVNGLCQPCRPDSKRCGTAGPELCSADGEWVPQAACGVEAPACLGGACVTCSPNERRCFNGAVELCNDTGTAWTTEEVCTGNTPACIASTKACGRCAEGDRQCSGDTVLTCDAQGNFQNGATCTGASPDCVGGACKACDPAAGDTQCATATSLSRCGPSGDWDPATACTGDTPLCRSDLGRCGCEENARRCAGDGTPERCVGGSWVRQARCTGGTPVCLASSGQCVACQPNSEICQSSIVQRCDSLGAYQSTGQCGSAQRNCGNCGIGGPCNVNTDCRSGACVGGACAECRPNDTQCVNSTPRTCSLQGTWVNAPAACTGDTPICVPQSATCACQEGTIRCAGSAAERRCVGGQFMQVPCPTGSACDASGRCVVTRKPQGGSCTTASECQNNLFCVDGVCCNEDCNGACETCATTGVCRMPTDDAACPNVACSAFANGCATTRTDITTNRCAAKGECKTTAACGISGRVACSTPTGFAGVCNTGQCIQTFVRCGGLDCPSAPFDVIRSGTCCVFNDGRNACDNYDTCFPARLPTFGGAAAYCDEPGDCPNGSLCCTDGAANVQCMTPAQCTAPLFPICDSPAIGAPLPCASGTCRPTRDFVPEFDIPGWSMCAG